MDRLTDGIQPCLSQRLHLFWQRAHVRLTVLTGEYWLFSAAHQTQSDGAFFYAFIRQNAPLVFKVDTIIPLHRMT